MDWFRRMSRPLFGDLVRQFLQRCSKVKAGHDALWTTNLSLGHPKEPTL